MGVVGGGIKATQPDNDAAKTPERVAEIKDLIPWPNAISPPPSLVKANSLPV
jgi:hypothetical protein